MNVIRVSSGSMKFPSRERACVDGRHIHDGSGVYLNAVTGGATGRNLAIQSAPAT